MRKEISIIIPARNEEIAIRGTLEAVLASAARFLAKPLSDLHLNRSILQVLVVDNLSTDKTAQVVAEFVKEYGVDYIICEQLGAPCARNSGTRLSQGSILVYVDADTQIPVNSLNVIHAHVRQGGRQAGIFALDGKEGSFSSRCWWLFWNHVRLLPLPKAKALPAFMFCTRDVFNELGPFDETVQIGEEWPILAGIYHKAPERLVYDRTLTAMTSNRRMTLQRFGYTRTFLKYVWAVLHVSGRNGYPDSFRHKP
jgi:glycosyltransferase involved in cell wall biosynthesis